MLVVAACMAACMLLWEWAKVVVMIDAKPSIGLIIATIEAWPKLPGFTEQIPEKKPPRHQLQTAVDPPPSRCPPWTTNCGILPRTSTVGTAVRPRIYCRTQTHDRLRLPSRLPTRPSIHLERTQTILLLSEAAVGSRLCALPTPDRDPGRQDGWSRWRTQEYGRSVSPWRLNEEGREELPLGPAPGTLRRRRRVFPSPDLIRG